MNDKTTREERLNEYEPSFSDLKLIADVVAYSVLAYVIINRLIEIYG